MNEGKGFATRLSTQFSDVKKSSSSTVDVKRNNKLVNNVSESMYLDIIIPT